MRLINTLITLTVTAAMLVTPSLASAANQTFAGIHYLVSTGKKAKEVKARLVLTDDSVRIYGERGAGSLTEIPYSDIQAATYSKSKHPRWKSGLIAAAALGMFAAPLFLMKAKKHWLTLQAEGDHMALRLSKKNFALVIAAVEGQTGVSVERIEE